MIFRTLPSELPQANRLPLLESILNTEDLKVTKIIRIKDIMVKFLVLKMDSSMLC